MLLINKTYEIITDESAENGDAEERGFEWENAECTVREAVDYLKGLEPSQYPITNPEYVWFTDYAHEPDYSTREYKNVSYHYSKDNPEKNLKFWITAIKAAGFVVKD